MPSERLPLETWDARVQAWRDRIGEIGLERSVVSKDTSAADLQRLQFKMVWPHVLAALTGTERRALDFGCGTGRWTPHLAAHIGYALGVDLLPEFVDYAEAHRPPTCGLSRLEYRPYMRGHIPAPDASFDVLWVCMVLGAILDDDMLAATARELRRVLRPGALVFLIDSVSRDDGQPIRTSHWVSRTVEEYQAVLAWAALEPVGRYIDHRELNTIYVGHVHADA